MALTTLKIDGMTCGGCVASVTRVLQQLPGVSRVEVSLQSGSAEVTHEPGLSAVEALIGAVESAGFDARRG
jgi:copper chaperone